jgi:tRNA pseudouridine38-40 synthase
VRIAVGLEYLGTAYAGWQRQDGLRTVQGEVESALSRVADHPVLTRCAGRTDAGVHATGQVIHFDSHAVRTARSWLLGANRHLPQDISLQCPLCGDDALVSVPHPERTRAFLSVDGPGLPLAHPPRRRPHA